MSLNNVIAFALLLKKITRKGSISKKSFQQKTKTRQTTTVSATSPTIKKDQEKKDSIKIRDFAYPIDSPLHFGKQVTKLDNNSTVSLSSPDFNGRDARALFDFFPETEYEVPLKAGQSVWVQYRQCPGWLIADVQDETGLIPESYVEFI